MAGIRVGIRHHPPDPAAAKGQDCAVVLPVYADDCGEDGGYSSAALRFQGFDGGCAQLALLDARPGDPLTVTLGLGQRDAISTNGLRTAAATVARRLGPGRFVEFRLPGDLPLPTPQAVRSAAEGFELGSDAARPGADLNVLITVDGEPDDEVRAACAEGVARARATVLARWLCNLPPNVLNPSSLTQAAVEMPSVVSAKVLGTAEIEAAGYGGLPAVGAGSSTAPRLVEIDHHPAGAVAHVALVGKGITFDAGGLCLKAAEWLPVMKSDMAGAAVVIAVMRALPALGLPIRVGGVLPIAENMPSGSAYRPGDVLTLGNGRTVEVTDTDAEGRIVLADGLVHACRLGPDLVIDLGTLSSSCVAALGTRFTVVSGNDAGLVDELVAAGKDADEPLCVFPLLDELPDELRSPIADLVNSGRTAGDAIQAAAFLREFVDHGRPWAHLDLIGPTWSLQDRAAHGKGATGAGVRTILSWLSLRYGGGRL